MCTTKEKAPPALDKFITASDSLYSKGVTVATIRCGGELPSGKKVMDRFKLTPPIKKAAFLCANGKKCQQLPAASMKTSDVSDRAPHTRLEELSTPRGNTPEYMI